MVAVTAMTKGHRKSQKVTEGHRRSFNSMAEIIGMCNRVIVMYEGAAAGELESEEITQEKIREKQQK